MLLRKDVRKIPLKIIPKGGNPAHVTKISCDHPYQTPSNMKPQNVEQ